MAPVARTLTSDGNYKNRALNGALTIVEPKTGMLFLSIVHKSTYEGQKRRAQIAREKAAEQVVAWLTSIPADERPQQGGPRGQGDGRCRAWVTNEFQHSGLRDDPSVFDKLVAMSQGDLNIPS